MVYNEAYHWTYNKGGFLKGREGSAIANGPIMFAFPEYGAFFGVENGRLLVAPMNVDGSIDRGSVGEVEDFGPKGFVRVMREYFGNSFWVPPALAYATITIRHNSGVTTQAMWAYTAGSQRQEELAFHEALTYAIRTFGDWR